MSLLNKLDIEANCHCGGLVNYKFLDVPYFEDKANEIKYYARAAIAIAKDFQSRTKSKGIEQKLEIKGKLRQFNHLNEGIENVKQTWMNKTAFISDKVELITTFAISSIAAITAGVLGYHFGSGPVTHVAYPIIGAGVGGISSAAIMINYLKLRDSYIQNGVEYYSQILKPVEEAIKPKILR